MRLEFIGASILFFAALFSVIARDTIAPGLVGLSVAYALQVCSTQPIIAIRREFKNSSGTIKECGLEFELFNAKFDVRNTKGLPVFKDFP